MSCLVCVPTLIIHDIYNRGRNVSDILFFLQDDDQGILRPKSSEKCSLLFSVIFGLFFYYCIPRSSVVFVHRGSSLSLLELMFGLRSETWTSGTIEVRLILFIMRFLNLGAQDIHVLTPKTDIGVKPKLRTGWE